jgi:hypothetical protein
MDSMELIMNFLNYGIAGLILYVFYKLFSNELKMLRKSIEDLRQSIEKLIILTTTKK